MAKIPQLSRAMLTMVSRAGSNKHAAAIKKSLASKLKEKSKQGFHSSYGMQKSPWSSRRRASGQ